MGRGWIGCVCDYLGRRRVVICKPSTPKHRHANVHTVGGRAARRTRLLLRLLRPAGRATTKPRGPMPAVVVRTAVVVKALPRAAAAAVAAGARTWGGMKRHRLLMLLRRAVEAAALALTTAAALTSISASSTTSGERRGKVGRGLLLRAMSVVLVCGWGRGRSIDLGGASLPLCLDLLI